jgi:hypothetical protein
MEEINSIGDLKRVIQSVVLDISTWQVLPDKKNPTSVKFRITSPVSLITLTKLSEAIGSDRINFDFGESGSPGYSEYTPGDPGSAGYIEILWPLLKTEDTVVKTDDEVSE